MDLFSAHLDRVRSMATLRVFREYLFPKHVAPPGPRRLRCGLRMPMGASGDAQNIALPTWPGPQEVRSAARNAAGSSTPMPSCAASGQVPKRLRSRTGHRSRKMSDGRPRTARFNMDAAPSSFGAGSSTPSQSESMNSAYQRQVMRTGTDQSAD